MMEMIDVVLNSVTELIAASSKGLLSFLSLIVVSVIVFAMYFFRSSTVAVKFGVFFLIILLVLVITGVAAYAYLGTPSLQSDRLGQSQSDTFQKPKPFDESTSSPPSSSNKDGEQCKDNNPSLECLWIG